MLEFCFKSSHRQKTLQRLNLLTHKLDMLTGRQALYYKLTCKLMCLLISKQTSRLANSLKNKVIDIHVAFIRAYIELFQRVSKFARQ